VLQLTDVWRTYQTETSEVIALREVNLRIDDGDFMSIMGPSGSGKSTMLQIIGLLDRPTRGTVRLDGQDLGRLSDAERTELRLHTIGFIFQRFHLLRDLTAIENVALPMEAAGLGVDERYDRAAGLLASVGLGDRLTFRPAQLSGGQRQRVAVARALANRPRLILADEPTGELHSEDKANVIELFLSLNAEGHTIVVVTHDPEVAAVGRRRVEMRDGWAREVAR
jgi:putative ABC transport system ATP-binding protein